MKELKPCPFCGGKGKLRHTCMGLSLTSSFVMCEKCGARTKEIEAATNICADDEAIIEWNKRNGEVE